MSAIDKKLVQQRFSRSLATYDSEAIVQSQTATKMLVKLIQLFGNRFPAILEIGCGTGLLSRQISNKLDYSLLLANDLVASCATHIADITNCRFVAGDIETLPPPAQQFDLIISNATFQWFNHLQRVLQKLTVWLKPGGVLAFSSFGPENIKELAILTGRQLPYYTRHSLCQLVSNEMRVVFDTEDIITLEFQSPLDVLRHLKATGVNSLTEFNPNAASFISSKTALEKFSVSYRSTHTTSQGKVSLTYHPLIIIAQKASQTK